MAAITAALAFLGGPAGMLEAIAVLGAPDGRMIYGGEIGWIHSEGLNQARSQMRRDLT
ncbi:MULTISPECIES: hypothetical protein [Kamptonema]|uniref:hypothetical protein n=1 Tax=Kamptonema TaxID=1501433 RepID=UPI0001DAC27E|nr:MULTISPECIES: hypothetical protein [Kamptonema]CBN55374.1 exported hypothetical protein [Kamptonema sp. PCC 6506]